MSDTNQPIYQEDEITLKEVILKVQEFVQEIWRYKWWVVAAGLIFASIFLIRALLEKPTYTATLTFMVNEEEGGNMGGIATILGQFGLSTGSQAGRFNKDKIIALARSRRIVQEVLFEEVNLGKENNYIANHIINLYEYQKAWEKDTLLQGFHFHHDSLPLFEEGERRALLTIYGQMIGNAREGIEGIISVNYNEDTGILSLDAKSTSERLSIPIANQLYEKLSRFYVAKTTEQQQKTFDNLQSKVDSIRTALYQKEELLAQTQDRSQNLLLRTDNVKQARLNREVQMLTIMYGEAIKNQETAGFLLRNSTPVFQVVDEPLSPINPTKNSKIKAILIGGFLGGFFSISFFIGRKIFKNIINNTPP